MTLQFDPQAYGQIIQRRQDMENQQRRAPFDSANQFGQTLSGLGSDMMAHQEKQKQDQMNQLLMKMKTDEEQRKWGNPQAQPMQADQSSYLPGVDSNKLSMGGGFGNQPNQPPQPLFASAGVSDTGMGEAKLPSLVDRHNDHLVSKGMPGVPSFQSEKPVPFDQMSFPDKLKTYGTEGLDTYTKYQGMENKDKITPYQQAQLDNERLKIKTEGNKNSNKDDSAALKDIQNAWMKDKNVVSSQGASDKLEAARGLLQAGTINNSVAKQALQTALTFVSTGGQRVNEAELKAFMGGQTKTNRLNQWLKSIDEGTLTTRDAQDMQGVISIYEKASKKNLRDSGFRYAKQLGQRTGNDPKSEYQRVTGDPYDDSLDSQSTDQGGGGGHPQDSQALQWARQNQNDPRAQKIIQLNGGQ